MALSKPMTCPIATSIWRCTPRTRRRFASYGWPSVELWAGDAGRAEQTARSARDRRRSRSSDDVVIVRTRRSSRPSPKISPASPSSSARRPSREAAFGALPHGRPGGPSGLAGRLRGIGWGHREDRAVGGALAYRRGDPPSDLHALLLARARGMVGEFARDEPPREGLSWSHRCNQRYLEAELWRVDGELAYRSGEAEAAAASLRSAVEIASAQGAAGWSFGRSTPSPVDFPIRQCVSSRTSSRLSRRAMISRRSEQQRAF